MSETTQNIKKETKLKFSELKGIKVHGIFAQPPTKTGPGAMVMLVELSGDQKGFLVFDVQDLCEIKPGIDFSSMTLRFVQTQIPNLSPIVKLAHGEPSTIEKVQSSLQLNSKKLLYRGLHEGKYWFDGDNFQCFDVMGLKVANFWIQWYYCRSKKAPIFLTHWVLADQDPFSSMVPVVVRDERCGSPIGYISNNILSSGNLLEMILSEFEYRHEPLLVEGGWKTIQDLIAKGNTARTQFYERMQDKHLFPNLPRYVIIGFQIDDEELKKHEEKINKQAEANAKNQLEFRRAMLKKQQEELAKLKEQEETTEEKGSVGYDVPERVNGKE